MLDAMAIATSDTSRRAPKGWDFGDDGVERAIAGVLVEQRVELGQAEGSVRHDRGRITGRRMMLDHAAPSVAPALARALGCGRTEAIESFSRVARADSAVLIAGWDVSGPEPIVKIYADVSDFTPSRRRQLIQRLGLSDIAGLAAIDAHVIGLNVAASGIVTKLYAQSNDPVALARNVPAASRLAESFADVCAGAVLAWDVREHVAAERAFFLAFRAGAQDRALPLCRALPSWSDAAIREALPFAPGPVRTVGFALRNLETWTAYFRPRDAPGETPATLDPIACMRCPAGEVGLYVVPVEAAAKTRFRTERSSVFYRVRAGGDFGVFAERLLTWAVARVEEAERSGSPCAALLTSPPAPWVLVRTDDS
jgi:hypothetical protein